MTVDEKNDVLELAASFLDHRELPESATLVRMLKQGKITPQDWDWANEKIDLIQRMPRG